MLNERGFQQTLAELAGASLSDSPDSVTRTVQALADYFNQREGVARSGTYTGTMVLSRFPLSVRSPGTDPAVEGTRSVQPELDVTAPEGTVRLKVAHPTAPLQGDTVQWRAGLRALQSWKQQLDGDELLVMAGDFNAGFGHPGFRDLADGLDDAQRTDGQGQGEEGLPPRATAAEEHLCRPLAVGLQEEHYQPYKHDRVGKEQ